MTSNIKNPKNSPGPESQAKGWMDKAVSKVFDELFAEISSKTDLHPSETFNKQVFLADYCNTKIYDFINSYHAYCRLCEQHFYCFSVADDINSFFQKHLNTSYHRQNRAFHPPSDDTPIFTWKEKFYSGRCNVCDMSGLNSYVLKTGVDLVKLMELHVCIWSKEHRQTNEKLLRKLTLIKKYCGLKIFQERYLKTMEGRDVCLLCRLSFASSGKKAVSHLSSDLHYQNFCSLLRMVFSFEPKDILNGFNLEMITRWAILLDSPTVTEFAEYDERKACLEHSNNDENPYFEDNDNFSFSPKLSRINLKNKETDFIHNRKCLLCNVEFKPGHSETPLHRARAANVGKYSFDALEKYLVYRKNREKRLHVADSLRKLDLGVLEVEAADRRAPTNDSQQEIFFKTLLVEKLKLVKEVFTVDADGNIFCQVCELNVSPSYERAHLYISHHKYHLHVWKVLERHLNNGKLMEPFMKIRNLLACLLCGVIFDQEGFCSHVKRANHIREFERYCKLNSRIPISSAFTFHKDFSCECTICNESLNQKQTFSSVKKTLLNVKSHWPCPKLNEKTKIPDKQKQSSQGDVPPGGQALPKVEETTRVVGCNNNTIDFKRVEETVENFLGVFENRIMDVVLDKSKNLINGLRVPENALAKQKLPLETDKRPKVQNHVISPPHRSDVALPPAKREVNPKVVKSEEPAEDESPEREVIPVKEEKNGVNAKDHEILVVGNLPQSKGKNLKKEIFSKFSEFGHVHYVHFENPTKTSKGNRTAIVAFAKAGVAGAVAAGPEVFLKGNKLEVLATTKELKAKADKSPPALNKELVPLLEDPEKLMNFLLNLIVQALRVTESPSEIKREELVCSAIIGAILACFPNGRCYPFGSRLSGLVLDNSDLDVFLDCGDMFDGFKNTSRSMEKKVVNQVAKLLKQRKEFVNFVVVERARVPIVSFVHRPTLMHCDLSFKNGLSVQNTLLIKFMVSLDWKVRPLILFLKHWAKLNKLHGPPFFSSYAIAMLVIFYLEQLERPLLPTIESLQNSYVGRRRTIAGWDCSFNTSYSFKSKNEDPLPQLLVGLFEFYGGFNYEAYMISPLSGKPLPREAYSDAGFTKLPLCYKRHVLNIPIPIKSTVNKNIPIYVVDPFDVSHILTKSFTPDGLKTFVEFCGTSAKYLKKGITGLQDH